jgi:hypothetical protein
MLPPHSLTCRQLRESSRHLTPPASSFSFGHSDGLDCCFGCGIGHDVGCFGCGIGHDVGHDVGATRCEHNMPTDSRAK